MKILGIMGSPRNGGNTEILLDSALQVAREIGVTVSKILLRDKVIATCNGCMRCIKTGKCVIKDDMQGIYRRMLESDGIIWATPIYFWSMSGLIKMVMDRTFALTFPRLQLANKVGGLIFVARTRGCVNAANIFHMYFNYNHMFATEFAFGYAGEKGEIRKNLFAMNMAGEMIRQMTSLIRANLKYPDEFNTPLQRFVTRKYHL